MSDTVVVGGCLFVSEHRASAELALGGLRQLIESGRVYANLDVRGEESRNRHSKVAYCLIRSLAEFVRYPEDVSVKIWIWSTKSELDEFVGDEEQSDDLTMLLLRREQIEQGETAYGVLHC